MTAAEESVGGDRVGGRGEERGESERDKRMENSWEKSAKENRRRATTDDAELWNLRRKLAGESW